VPILPAHRAAEVVLVLLRGRVAAIPTDTVYGLAARLDDPAAVQKLAEMKGRDFDQPIAVLIARPDAVTQYLTSPERLDAVAKHWPGALTAVVQARPDAGLPSQIVSRAEGDPMATIGVRQPDDPVAIEVIRSCGGALAVTSANLHGEPPATSAAEVARIFGPDLPILDGGDRPGHVASTVVDLTGDPPKILREGPVSATDLGLTEAAS
jgi:tRNA threonylcarbamoyl adenosine modification protein (Sua5/YciO/YrdC/YwlC family)